MPCKSLNISASTIRPAVLSAAMLLLGATAAQADDAAFRRCRALGDAAQRLACYDALPLSAGPAAGTTSAAGAPIPPRQAAEQFGIEHRGFDQRLEVIESSINGRFDGWGPKDRITLANGQVWQVIDDSRGAMDKTNPKVRVRRGALGAFFLEIEGTNRSPKVKRVD